MTLKIISHHFQNAQENLFHDVKQIKFENVSFDYNENKNENEFILQKINLEINNNEFIGIFGDIPEKSTLIDILSGLIEPHQEK